MRVYARHCLTNNIALQRGTPALLLEGTWPEGERGPERESLDDAIDARQGWIDEAAASLAEAAAGGSAHDVWPPGGPTFAWFNVLKLRYFLVKLLRIIAFFDGRSSTQSEPSIDFVGERGRDDEYDPLLAAIAVAKTCRYRVEWVCATPPTVATLPSAPAWRRGAARCAAWMSAHARKQSATGPCVLLCGNPRLLDPVCEELNARGAQVAWLWETFCCRSWLRWRRRGVEQIICSVRDSDDACFAEPGRLPPLRVRGVALADIVSRWLGDCMARHGRAQARLFTAIERLFAQRRFDRLVLDEDATPRARIVLAAARRHGVESVVVQHGAPYIRFGFAPVVADRICAWGEPSRERLLGWEVPEGRIEITGSPLADQFCALSRRAHSIRPRQVLLLASPIPDVGRPDAVEFHQTLENYVETLRGACAVVARLRARLVIKLHPRAGDARLIADIAGRTPGLRYRMLRRGSLQRLVAASHCVLSCASTAGFEAALAGVPVIELLPRGSGTMLSAQEWNLAGVARSEAELAKLLDELWGLTATGPEDNSSIRRDVFSSGPTTAASRIVDVVLRTQSPTVPKTSFERRGPSRSAHRHLVRTAG